VSLNKADGSAIGTFADGDATSAGGFYGTNAEHVAGVLLGIGEFKDDDGSTNSIFLSSDFWGTVEPEIVATTK
jgi:hypothetical protein